MTNMGALDPRFVTPANRSLDIVTGSRTNSKDADDLHDLLSVLKAQNRKIVRERLVPGTLPFQTTPTPVVELMFHLCASFELPTEVKFLALEILDRFVIMHFTDLWHLSCERSTNQRTQRKYWHRISSQVAKQALLRAVSSIQIASKFVLQSKSLTLKDVHKYLSTCGHAYSIHSIYLSEVRVFSTLGCKVPIYSIYDFTSTLLQGLQSWTDVDAIYITCDKVLEFTFLQRDEIYLRYFWMATGRWERSRHERLEFAEVELDYFLMASSVIVSSLYIHHLEGLGPNKASEILSDLGDIDSNDIRGLAITISQMILGTRRVSFKSCG